MEWIDVNDKLPEKFSVVLAQKKDGSTVKSYYHGDGLGRLATYFKPGVISEFQSTEDKSFLHDVTHWKPLN
jgi:hypothetical protein